jgi:hypothetical protein
LEVAASIHQEEEEISTIEEVAPQEETETMNQTVETPAVIEASASNTNHFCNRKTRVQNANRC